MDQKIQKVVIDCDPGIDDSLALMLALSMGGDPGGGHYHRMWEQPGRYGLFQHKKNFKAYGASGYSHLCGSRKAAEAGLCECPVPMGPMGWGESFLPEVPGYENSMTAQEFLKKRFVPGQEGGPCSVIALGPMTIWPACFRTVRKQSFPWTRIVSMGGSFKSHGNCSPVAEYNYWADPDAAALVYETAPCTERRSR